MQFLAEPRPSGACNSSLLGVPGPGAGDATADWDEDDCDLGTGPRPKSSPLPRRRMSQCEEDYEPEVPPTRSRRVSFADAQGLSLVHVKQFDQWDLPNLPRYESLEGKVHDDEDYYVSPMFSPPASPEELLRRVQEQRLELEAIELLPRTTTLKGLIRVLNISFDKKVYVRTSLNAWASHFDLLAEYAPGFSDGATDCFSFKLTLVPPFRAQGARVDFCLRYETPVGTFWSNNGDRNYVVFCHQRVKEIKAKPQKENAEKKSCLKAVSQNFPIPESWSSIENLPSDESMYEEVASTKAQQIHDSQSGTSEDHHKLQVENSRNYSRRSRRRAARLARVKDYFSERGGGDASNGESNASAPETSRIAAPRESTPEIHSNGSETPSRPERGESEVIPDSMATSRELSPDVQRETSPAQRTPSKVESEKSTAIASSVNSEMAARDTAALPNDLSSSKVQPMSPCQNLSESVSGAGEAAGTTGAESTSDSDVTLLEAHTNCFTFGTVVAPLYQQVVGRAEGESQSLADHGNPARERLNKRDSTTCSAPNYSHPERSETHSSAKDARKSHAEAPRDPAEARESDQQTKEPAPISEEGRGLPRTPETSAADPWRAHVPRGTSCLQGKAREDALTRDLQRSSPVRAPQITVETTCAREPPEDTSSHAETLEGAALQTQADMACTSANFSQAHVSQLVSMDVSGGLNGRECVDEPKGKEDTHGATATNSERDTPVVIMSAKDVKDTDTRREDVDKEKTAEERNWEKMVEEEEVDVLSDEQGNAETEDKQETEEVGKEEGKQTEGEQRLEKGEMELEGVEEDERLTEERAVEEIVVGEEEVEDKFEEEDIQWAEDQGKEEAEWREQMETNMSEGEEDMGAEWEEIEPKEGDMGEEEEGEEEGGITVRRVEEEMEVDEVGETEVKGEKEEEIEEDVKTENSEDETGGLEQSSDTIQDKYTNVCITDGIHLYTEENDDTAKDRRRVTDWERAEGEVCILTDDPERDPAEEEEDSASAESLSDDEVELYMHCLRAVQKRDLDLAATRDRGKDMGFSVPRRPSIVRGRQLRMPSISESVNEEHPSTDDDQVETPGSPPTASPSAGEESAAGNVVWWRETFSCSNILKALLFTVLLVVFFAVAYHYDFLACFALYLVSVFWLWGQGGKKPVKNNNRLG